MRIRLFQLSLALDGAAAAIVIIFWRISMRWDGLYGHINDLGRWVTWGFLLSMTAFALAWFGRSWQRIAALAVSAAIAYFWYGQGMAV
jgi:hypothetical protein